jgi:hypothetical protein
MPPKLRPYVVCLLVKRPLCCYLIGFRLESVDVARSVDGAVHRDDDTYNFPSILAKLGQLVDKFWGVTYFDLVFPLCHGLTIHFPSVAVKHLYLYQLRQKRTAVNVSGRLSCAPQHQNASSIRLPGWAARLKKYVPPEITAIRSHPAVPTRVMKTLNRPASSLL